MGFHDYIQALQEEKKKIQVFPRDLPLSLELVTQAIEKCKQQLSGITTEYNLNGETECSEQTSMEEGREVPRKTNVVEVKRSVGAFHPFHREEISAEKDNASKTCKESTTSPQVPSTSSTEPVVGTSSKRDDKGQRKQRRCWSQELHKRFLNALQQLGAATPKQIRELMNVDGLTNDEVKSHLQLQNPVIHGLLS
ncbi:hypothetical protein TSUD_241860 [Trifolium subterraneum]|uniref:HTH myb-type domain-containing protein n=1 Tax=Trifolium subterraneum TaxID=3900 RepID=A0A2Z6NQJ3_TRISU|nr:hypothetical protein TSUD_241860 [Trifolium subterraneum]